MLANLENFKKGNVVSIIMNNGKEHKGLFLESDERFIKLFPVIRKGYFDDVNTIWIEDVQDIKSTRLPKGLSEELKAVYKEYLEIKKFKKEIKAIESKIDKKREKMNKKHDKIKNDFIMKSKSIDKSIIAREIASKITDNVQGENEYNSFATAVEKDNKVYIEITLTKYLSRYFSKEDYVASEQYDACDINSLIQRHKPHLNVSHFEKVSKKFETNVSTGLHDKGTVSIDTSIRFNVNKLAKPDNISFIVKELTKGIQENSSNLREVSFF